MRAAKRTKLEAAGWKVGSVNEFLGLTPKDHTRIEINLRLSNTSKVLYETQNLKKFKNSSVKEQYKVDT